MTDEQFGVSGLPLSMTCGRTCFVHASSLVWAVWCSFRDMVVMPTTLWVLEILMQVKLENPAYDSEYLPLMQGTVVWKALAVES